MSAPQLKLTYFDMAGRAELTRLIFTFGGVAFEDCRVTGPEFGAMKPTLLLGQLPILEVDGVVYSQSMAIARYAAKLAGLYPEDPVQALHAEMASETCIDLLNGIVDVIFLTPDEATKAEKKTKFLTETLPKSLSALESRVQGKFFAGDITFADVHLFVFIETMLKAKLPEASTAAYPNLEALVEGVKANANIAAYLAK